MAFMDFLFGDKEKTEQFDRFTPSQQTSLDQILGGASGQLPQAFQFLSQILGQSPEMMEKFQAPARRAFNEKTVPSIAERFTGMGAQKSSAFGQQLGQAGAGLEEALSAQRSGLGFQGLTQLQGLLGQGLTPQFETSVSPATQGIAPGAIDAIIKILPFLLV